MPEQVAVYLMSTEAEADCLACGFTVERLVEMLHRNSVVFCWVHAQAAVAHGDTLTRSVALERPSGISPATEHVMVVKGLG